VHENTGFKCIFIRQLQLVIVNDKLLIICSDVL
jgi:hypothetical protein